MFTSDKYKCSNNTAHVCRACFRRLATTFVHETQPAACLSFYIPCKIAYTHEQSSTHYPEQHEQWCYVIAHAERAGAMDLVVHVRRRERTGSPIPQLHRNAS